LRVFDDKSLQLGGNIFLLLVQLCKIHRKITLKLQAINHD